MFVLKGLAEWWNSYKHRFVPWMALQMGRRKMIKAEKQLIIPPAELQATVGELVKYLDSVPVWTKKADPFSPSVDNLTNLGNAKSITDLVGFSLKVRKSKIPKSGRGVFVEAGTVQPDTLVALYPGTVYDAGEPLLLQSLGNPYIIQCVDGCYIDGKSGGISRLIYKSCANRDFFHGHRWCDISWLDAKLMTNPYAVGQYVNNERLPEFSANVAYHEFEIPPDFDLKYRRPLRMIGLVSLRCIGAGEELYSTYFAAFHQK